MNEKLEYPIYGIVEYTDTKPMNADAMLALDGITLLGIKDHRFRWRDIEEDTRSNKRTLAVRFGKTGGRVSVTLWCLLP